MAGIAPGLDGYIAAQQLGQQRQAQELGMLSKILQMRQMQDEAAANAEMRPLQMDALRAQIAERKAKAEGALMQRNAQGALSRLQLTGGYTGQTVAPATVAQDDNAALAQFGFMKGPDGSLVRIPGTVDRSASRDEPGFAGDVAVNVPSQPAVRALTSIAFPDAYGKAQADSLFPKPVAPVAPSGISKLIAERDALPVGDPRRQIYENALSKETTIPPREGREPSAPVAVVTRDGKGTEFVSRADAIGRVPANIDPETQGRLAGAKQAARGTAQAAQATADDQKAAMRALQAAGYNPATGKDAISDLIDASTSGIVQRGAAAVPGAFGISTSGMVALRKVESMANSIVLDLMNRKLGAGISNADRDFIVSQLGDVGNAIKPAEERKGAWQKARDRMIEVGLHPAMGGGASTAPSPTSSSNPDVDAALAKYGTRP